VKEKKNKSKGALASQRRRIWNIALGIFFFILGVIGILIPVMPQLAFFFLSAIFFSRASKRFRTALRRWRKRHPKVERAYQSWRRKAREKRRALIRRLRDERDTLIVGE
jgi:hypothetical protein